MLRNCFSSICLRLTVQILSNKRVLSCCLNDEVIHSKAIAVSLIMGYSLMYENASNFDSLMSGLLKYEEVNPAIS